jgi:hypothetical protein
VDGFAVDPNQIRGQGIALGHVGQSFGDQLGQFRAGLSAYEGAWGDDTIGGLIGTAYNVVSQWAFECWKEVADELSSAGQDLAGMASAYEETDQKAAEDLGRLQELLG